MTREEKLLKVETEIQYYLGNFELGCEFHDYYLTRESEAALSVIPQVLFLVGVISIGEKVEMNEKIMKKKMKIKENIKYGKE